MKDRAAGLSLLLAAASACTVGPTYTRPPVGVPETWREAPTGVATEPGTTLETWWMTFEDPLLADLIARAVDGNIDLKISAARVKEARALRGIAASASLPQVDATGSYGRVSRSEAVPPFRAASGEGSPFGARESERLRGGLRRLVGAGRLWRRSAGRRGGSSPGTGRGGKRARCPGLAPCGGRENLCRATGLAAAARARRRDAPGAAGDAGAGVRPLRRRTGDGARRRACPGVSRIDCE